MRAVALVLLGLVTAGCGAGDAAPSAPAAPASAAPVPPAPAAPTARPLPPGPLAPSAQLRARFGGLVDTIEIYAVERLPLRAADLVAPDGSVVPASYIAVNANPRLATGQWAVSRRWDIPVSPEDALAAAAVQNAQAGAALYGTQQLLAVVSTANITLPDPVAYRRDWQEWRIRLTFGTPPGEVETIQIAAPAPPPAGG